MGMSYGVLNRPVQVESIRERVKMDYIGIAVCATSTPSVSEAASPLNPQTGPRDY